MKRVQCRAKKSAHRVWPTPWMVHYRVKEKRKKRRKNQESLFGNNRNLSSVFGFGTLKPEAEGACLREPWDLLPA